MSKTPENTIKSSGADAGDILLGIHPNGNFGLLIEISERQLMGHGGRIQGAFRVLHEGRGRYCQGIKAVIDNADFFNSAADFIALVSGRPGCQDCTHILNANALWKMDLDLIYRDIVTRSDEHTNDDEVQRCLQCGQIYTDLTLNFCLNDGTALSREPAEMDTRVINRDNEQYPDLAPVTLRASGRGSRKTESSGYEFIRAAVSSHPNLDLVVHQGFNHRITKDGHVGSMWIIPRGNGVSITANGKAAQRLYREMERLLGHHHREDVKGYRYWQADSEKDVQSIIGIWSRI